MIFIGDCFFNSILNFKTEFLSQFKVFLATMGFEKYQLYSLRIELKKKKKKKTVVGRGLNLLVSSFIYNFQHFHLLGVNTEQCDWLFQSPQVTHYSYWSMLDSKYYTFKSCNLAQEICGLF